MDQLPTDIVRIILEIIDREDLLSFRLTCRSFAALGLPRQFEVIPVVVFRNSLENLLRISEHPTYRNYVLTIEYGSDMVSNPKSRIHWTRTSNLLPDPQNNLFSESDIEEAYQSHVRYYDDQKHMKATGYDFKTLRSAISRLPNLRGVRLISSHIENGRRFRNPPPGWGDAFCHMTKIMSNRELFFLQWRPSRFIRETTAVLAACKLAPKAISRLDCKRFELGLLSCDEDDDEDEGGGGVENGGEDEDEDDYSSRIVRLSRFNKFVRDPTKDLGPPLMCATFQSLTIVKLEIVFTRSPNFELYQQRLGTALRSAQGLQTLHIKHPDSNYLNRRLSFTPLLGSSTWPHLSHLSLSSFTIHSHDLPPFLARHPSLTHFTLSHAFAHDFDWATLLQSPPLLTRLRNLHSLTLTGTWGATAWTSALAADVAAQPAFDIWGYLEGEDVDWFFPEALGGSVDLNAPFAKWAQDVSGARCFSEVLERYVFAGKGEEVEFPLRTGGEVGEALARVKEMVGGVLGYRAGNLLVVNEAVVGEEYRKRNLYREYTEDGEEVVEDVESEDGEVEESMAADGGEEEGGGEGEVGLLEESVVGGGGEEEGGGGR
ncbi:hypothetical protein VF21_05104 [Pseudogymnoascus sp. 05NY08]|nr:hypothetical protein VF21_05104 [Pseudogymnoascus sp. 05NY08]